MSHAFSPVQLCGSKSGKATSFAVVSSLIVTSTTSSALLSAAAASEVWGPKEDAEGGLGERLTARTAPGFHAYTLLVKKSSTVSEISSAMMKW